MRFGLVIPTYKSAAFIEQTLESAFRQTVPFDDVVVVDDASPDETCAAVERAMARTPVPCRLIRLTTNFGGPARPTNRGIEACDADYILCLDHDDELVPGRVESLRRVEAHLDTCGLTFGRMRVRSSATTSSAGVEKAWTFVQSLPLERIVEGFLRLAPNEARAAYVRFDELFAVSMSAFGFPKGVWSEVGGFDEQFRGCADAAFYEAVTRSYSIGILESDAAYKQFLGSNLSEDWSLMTEDHSDVFARFHAWYRNHPCPAELKPHLRSELLKRAYMLVSRRKRRAGYSSLARSISYYGLDARTFATAFRMQVKLLSGLIK